MRRRLGRLLALGASVVVTSAHVGSPDTYFEGAAGPYPVRVIIRNPGVVPGLAQITVRLLGPGSVRRVLVLPVYWDPRTAAPPPADVAERVPGDSTLYSAALWLMRGGSYSVQVSIEGANGTGAALVPVMAVATRRLELEQSLGVGLLGLSAFLFIGALTIVRAAVRESVLAPGEQPDRRRAVRAWVATAASAAVLALALIGGRAWWNAVDAAYARGLFQPLHGAATVREGPGGGRVLRFTIDDTSWTNRQRQWTPLIPDHGHLMHLFLVRAQSLDGFAHLHPLPRDSTTFEAKVPPLPPGTYHLYADLVHESGFAQTLVATLQIASPATTWQPSDGDDAWLGDGPQRSASGPAQTAPLADGSTMTWERGDAPIVVDAEAPLRFAVTAPDGKPAVLEPYMGMQAHAMIARDDGAVFVHLHPAGTISLAAQQAFVLRQPGDTAWGELGKRLAAMDMGSGRSGAALPGDVSFPYAFPQPGRYRLWVQVKRHGRILTGGFDADVKPAR
jgi:hypothetical protein